MKKGKDRNGVPVCIHVPVFYSINQQREITYDVYEMSKVFDILVDCLPKTKKRK